MNVLVVSEPGVDGVFRYVDNLCHFLASTGATVHLAYSDRRGSEGLARLIRWVEARGGRTLNLQTANRPTMADLRASLALRRLVHAVKPDVIHSHSSKAGFLARSLTLVGVRAVQCYHPHAYVGMRPVPGRFDRIYNTIEALLGRIAHTIIVSEGERDFALQRLRLPPQRVHLVHNGVDLQRFTPVSAEEKARLRVALGLPVDAPVLGFLGRSSPQKDPITLYRAFGRVAAERPIRLFHIGHGELDEELAQLTGNSPWRDRVIRRDYLDTPADFYRAVDGFILTSRYEGCSLAALEALACNLPVILSDVAGNHDLLDLPLTHSWRAAPGDEAAFAAAIAGWSDRLEEGDTPNHRQIARAHFDLSQQYGKVLGLYDTLLAA
jgi:glycosyltransferase involved in cell wall biosynthesis